MYLANFWLYSRYSSVPSINRTKPARNCYNESMFHSRHEQTIQFDRTLIQLPIFPPDTVRFRRVASTWRHITSITTSLLSPNPAYPKDHFSRAEVDLFPPPTIYGSVEDWGSYVAGLMRALNWPSINRWRNIVPDGHAQAKLAVIGPCIPKSTFPSVHA